MSAQKWWKCLDDEIIERSAVQPACWYCGMAMGRHEDQIENEAGDRLPNGYSGMRWYPHADL